MRNLLFLFYCATVAPLERVQTIYYNSPTINVCGVGISGRPEHGGFQLSNGASNLTSVGDFTVVVDGDCLTLILASNKSWVNLDNEIFPTPLKLSPLKIPSESFSTRLSKPVVIANVIDFPSLHQNVYYIDTEHPTELRITGTGLIGVEAFDCRFNSPKDDEERIYEVTSSFPLRSNEIVLKLRDGKQWPIVDGCLVVAYINTGGGPIKVVTENDKRRDGHKKNRRLIGHDVEKAAFAEADEAERWTRLSNGEGSVTFSFTGAAQTYVVPAGVNSVTVTATGAQGGQTGQGSNPIASVQPGKGGLIVATISVDPLSHLLVYVGGQGHTGLNGNVGGFNGGGSSSRWSDKWGGGGGGGSDVRTVQGSLASRLVVAGGGGGAGSNQPGAAGGGSTGGSRYSFGGGGGSQTTAGLGGSNGAANGAGGTLGLGGNGASHWDGGGGGGGYYGGGGAGSGGGGGGGGSSYSSGVVTSNLQGAQSGDGFLTIAVAGCSEGYTLDGTTGSCAAIELSPAPSTMTTTAPSLQQTTQSSRAPSFRPSSLIPDPKHSMSPSIIPSIVPSIVPSILPTIIPSIAPSSLSSVLPTVKPTVKSTPKPSAIPSNQPTKTTQTQQPTPVAIPAPTSTPSISLTATPTLNPSAAPTLNPTATPSLNPTATPTRDPTATLTLNPTAAPTLNPTEEPSAEPTYAPHPTIVSVKPVEIDPYNLVIIGLVFANGFCAGAALICCCNYFWAWVWRRRERGWGAGRPSTANYELVATAERRDENSA